MHKTLAREVWRGLCCRGHLCCPRPCPLAGRYLIAEGKKQQTQHGLILACDLSEMETG